MITSNHEDLDQLLCDPKWIKNLFTFDDMLVVNVSKAQDVFCQMNLTSLVKSMALTLDISEFQHEVGSKFDFSKK